MSGAFASWAAAQHAWRSHARRQQCQVNAPGTQRCPFVSQAATYFVTDVAGIAIEMKYHAFDFYKIWQEPAMARKLIGVLMITNAFGSLSCALQRPKPAPRQ